nr:sel1 repeat family protein [Deltaproteobacteria bacterium]
MRHPTWKIILLGLGAFLSSGAALKEVPRERALDALRKEFVREGVGATRATLDAAYALACEDGYLPVCDPSRWRPEDQPTLAELRHVFEVPCVKGDPAACTVLGWVADDAARNANSVDEGTPLYRQAARHWKTACDNAKYQPACYEYADQLFEARGIVAEPAAGVVRWEKSCNAGYAPACARLAVLHTDGAPGARVDVEKALSYAGKACAAGDVNGCAARDVLIAPADAAAAAGGH